MPKRHTTTILTQAEFLRQQMNTTKTFVKRQLPPGRQWLVALIQVDDAIDIGEDDTPTEAVREIERGINLVRHVLPDAEVIIRGRVEPALLFPGDATFALNLIVRDDTPDPSKVPAPE